MAETLLPLRQLLEGLCRGHGMHICVHDISGVLSSPMLALPYRFRTHDTTYCDAAQGTPRGYRVWATCRSTARGKRCCARAPAALPAFPRSACAGKRRSWSRWKIWKCISPSRGWWQGISAHCTGRVAPRPPRARIGRWKRFGSTPRCRGSRRFGWRTRRGCTTSTRSTRGGCFASRWAAPFTNT